MPITIVQPAANALFNIDATPRMPVISCQAQITGVQPDPTATAAFDWSIQITETVRASTCPSSRRGNCSLTVNQQGVVGGTWTPAFTSIQGGDAVITVTARVGNAPLQASVNVRIRGTNPGRAAVTQRAGGAGTAGDRIACHESGRRQFDGQGMPLLGPGGDVGVMQLCNPAASCEERWSWTDNVDAGLALVTQKEREARTYLNQHRVNGQYLNDKGLVDGDVLLRETLQRYNGGRYWQWNTAQNRWVATPPSTYVATVLACN